VVTLTFEGVGYQALEGQTVLSALEAAGLRVESSCRAGVCQSCLLQSLDGPPPAAAQIGLSRALARDGCFMACVCVPDRPMAIARAGHARQRAQVVVRSISRLSDSVVRVVIEPLSPFEARPGQFLSLVDPATDTVRSYSIAGRNQGLIELHIRIVPGGRMSGLVSSRLSPGDRLTITGPSGACVYEGVDPDQRIVLAGTGTGLAPLWAILNEALAQGHRGNIVLYHGALDARGLYLVDSLEALQASDPRFRYVPCLMNSGERARADLVNAVASAETDFANTAYFLCGDEEMVKRLKRTLFLAGAKLDRIRADAFVSAPVRAAA